MGRDVTLGLVGIGFLALAYFIAIEFAKVLVG